jgi:molybdate transport system substrate-binding protein
LENIMYLWKAFLSLAGFSLVVGATCYAALPPQELIISAAASLTNAFQEMGQKFEQLHPGVRVVLNFAASGPLLQQIAQGAPVDVFAAADQKTMDQAQQQGLIQPTSRKNFAANRLVLIAPAKSKLDLKALADLSKPEVQRLALGNPDTVPAGRYTKEALVTAGLWESLGAKFILGESVRQVLDYVRRGEVDAGFVFATDAAVARQQVRVVQEAKGHQPIVYPVALVSRSVHQELARDFLDFIFSREGQAILSSYGFASPASR